MRGHKILWGLFAAAICVALAVYAGHAIKQMRDPSRQKAMLGNIRQLAASENQHFLEMGYRIFVTYDDLVGRDRYLKALNPVAGEDYRALFPHRYGSSWVIVSPGGLRAEYDDELDAGHPTDGVHVIPLGDGRRFEVTYRSGVPDGPFRAYYADGVLWGETIYVKGRVTGPAWLFTRDGRKFDELVDGDMAAAALAAGAEAGTKDIAARGAEKLRTGDFSGANNDLSTAVAINPTDLSLRRPRGDARKSLGDLDGAIEDYCLAEGFPSDQAMWHRLSDPLLNLFLERGRLRQTKNDQPGATKDFHVVARAMTWRAVQALNDHSYAEAVTKSTIGIDAAPAAELHALRAAARHALGEFAGAETDYSRAIELAAQGVMLNARDNIIMPAQWLYNRGHARRLLGNLPGAVEDFRAAQTGLGTIDVIQVTDAAFWLFLTQCEQGRKPEAVAELARMNQSDWMEWNRQFARFLQGGSTEAELTAFAAAGHNQPILFRAAFFSAMMRRFSGDEAGALERFHSALKHDTYDNFAKDEARRAIPTATP